MHRSEALSPRDALGARVAAFVLDALLVLLAAGPLAGAAGWVMAAVFAVLYLGVLPGVTGYTCGKALLGVKVVKRGTTEPAGPVSGVVRGVIGLVEQTVFVIGAVAAGTDDERRRLGDRAGGAEVIGLGLPGRAVAGYTLAYLALASLFLGLSTVDTLLVVWALAIPIAVGFLAVVLGARRQPAAMPWLVTAAFAVIPAAYLSFAGLCARGEGTCGDLGDDRKAIPALIILALTLGAFFLLKGGAARAVLAAGTVVGGVYMVTRLLAAEDMTIGAVLLILLLLVCLLSEVLGRVAADRARRAAGAAAPA